MDTIRSIYEKNQGVLRLLPIFVPRRFGAAGHRLKLHPDDYFALGTARGSIKERWFSSVIQAMNGPLAAPDEGMSYVNVTGTTEGKILFKDFIDTLGADILGRELFDKHGTWPMYSKFFDYEGPLFHHLHLDFESAARVGKIGKPEAYYFPRQLNNYPGHAPYTYFGFDPDCTPEEIKARLRDFLARDTRITELSRAYRIELGTGWYTPPGVIHAPGSYLTYEPQWNSDVNSVYENICDNEIYGKDFLYENCPADKQDDVDYVFSLLDWEKNTDPHYKKTFFRPPVTAREGDGFVEKWIAYANPYIAAKELTVEPGREVVADDPFAYGCILTQGRGRIGPHACAAATMLRFGGVSEDEFFVGEPAARKGLVVRNESDCEPLVMLKHFPANGTVPQTVG